MNTFNRLFVMCLFAAVAVGAALFILCLTKNFDWVNNGSLHIQGHAQNAARDTVNAVRGGMAGDLWLWYLGATVLLVVSLLVVGLEIQSLRPVPGLVLHRDKDGVTTLDLSALSELACWMATDADGVEALPVAKVHPQGKRLLVTAVALLNPYVNAQEVVPVLQQKLQVSLARASGFPVQVRLRSRFQDPRVRRKPR